MDARIASEISSCLTDLDALERDLRNTETQIRNNSKGIGLEPVVQELENMIMQYRKIANRLRSIR